MSATEAWVRTEAPELLSGPLAKDVAQFIAEDDLNGLAHYLQRRVERYQDVVAQAADVASEERRLDTQNKRPPSPRAARDMSEADKNLHIAQMEAERRVLDDMMLKKDQTIKELQEQVQSLQQQREP